MSGTFLRIVPDVVFEILSTATASRDRGERKGIYEHNGVREYWLVDAWAREMLVFDLVAGRFGRERVFAEHERPRSLVIEALEIAMAEVMA